MTKRHSRNSIIAKARLRRARVPAVAPLPSRCPAPPRRAKWRIQIIDLEHGDSLTLTLHRLPWRARYIDSQGAEYSAAQIGRAVAALLTHAA